VSHLKISLTVDDDVWRKREPEREPERNPSVFISVVRKQTYPFCCFEERSSRAHHHDDVGLPPVELQPFFPIRSYSSGHRSWQKQVGKLSLTLGTYFSFQLDDVQLETVRRSMFS
jgi:hypothetical protein